MNSVKTVLLVNHYKSQCGVYQYGVDIYSSLKKSTKYDFQYAECKDVTELDLIKVNYSPEVIIYNYHPVTMPWIHTTVRVKGLKQICIMHEVDPDVSESFSNILFDEYIVANPVFSSNKDFVHSSERLILNKEVYKKNKKIPIITSYGFGFKHKGFEDIVNLVKREFSKAIVRFNMPYNQHIEVDGKPNIPNGNKKETKIIIDSCRKISHGSGIDLRITHDYMSKDELFDFLSDSTVNIFLYKRGCWGISSVIDSALAVRRPIAISRNKMFQHIYDATPSICVENNSLKTIISNGITPLLPYYEKWSEENFIKRYENIIEKACNGM